MQRAGGHRLKGHSSSAVPTRWQYSATLPGLPASLSVAGGKIRAGTKNWVISAQLEPVRKEKSKAASVCHSKWGRDVGQTSTGRGVLGAWWEVMRWC